MLTFFEKLSIAVLIIIIVFYIDATITDGRLFAILLIMGLFAGSLGSIIFKIPHPKIHHRKSDEFNIQDFTAYCFMIIVSIVQFLLWLYFCFY